MNRFATSSFVTLALFAATAASAGVPSPINSSFPPCLVACPMGDIHQVVIVRDFGNNPTAGSTVLFDFSGCPGAFLCAARPNDPYIVDPATRTIRMTSDAAGRAEFPLRVGGTGAAGSVKLFADGVLFAS